ncbi:putative porin [Methyloferula stellata]|uniref:putative porin n=1 Tax=Methyloferula stellata TaxID=876270 RepID=UPI00190F5A8A
MRLTRHRGLLSGAGCALCLVLVTNLSSSAVAQDTDQSAPPSKSSVSRKKPTSPIAMVNLVNLLVQQGVVTEEQGKALIKQAEDQASVARESAKDVSVKAVEAAKAANAAAAAAMPAGTKRVTYVPEFVKKQIRDELKEEVMKTAARDNWASPGLYPEWASRIRLYGDFRARYEGDYYPSGNASLVNFGAINGGSPFDMLGASYPPSLDTDQDRNRIRLRARLGIDANVYDGFSVGLRLATGDSNSPVSTNQTLGSSGGNFSKYQIWLDRAFLKYQPIENVAFKVGRFENPFFAPSELVWDQDLNFDGFAVQTKYEIAPGVVPFANAGAFPIYNTDLNFGSTNFANSNAGNPVKYSSQDKWLFGGQLGVSWKPAQDYTVKFAAAYYDFSNVQGRVSSPCVVLSATDSCNTDNLRPSFAQNGNTYMFLRNVVPNGASEYQYFGLASPFRDVVLTGLIDFGQFHPVHITLDGEYVRNVAFNSASIGSVAVNNLGPDFGIAAPGTFAGGANGWFGRITVGYPELTKLWDWNVNFGYKYIESDAVIDAFTDSDFGAVGGLGGTNLKGYIIGGNLGLSSNVWLAARWMSANSISGAPYTSDVFQLDLNAKF